MYRGPHRAEIMSPLCLCRAQLSTPTYLDCHTETEKPSPERRACEIMGEYKEGRERKKEEKEQKMKKNETK